MRRIEKIDSSRCCCAGLGGLANDLDLTQSYTTNATSKKVIDEATETRIKILKSLGADDCDNTDPDLFMISFNFTSKHTV